MDHDTADVFGAPAGDLARIAVALRAVAARHGIELAEVGTLDAAAAAVGATVWCAATGATRFSEVPLSGPAAAEALSRVLMRAAGRPVPPVPHTGVEVPDDEVVAAAEAAVEILTESDGTLDVGEVANRAAGDLAGAGGVFAAAAAALTAAA